MLGIGALCEFALCSLPDALQSVPDVAKKWPEDAGQPARDKRQKRRKVIIGERTYWATDTELPGLLQALLLRKDDPEKKRERAKPRKTIKRTTRIVMPDSKPETLMPIAERYKVMLREFKAKSDPQAEAALVAAYRSAMLALQQDEDDVEMLLLRH